MTRQRHSTATSDVDWRGALVARIDSGASAPSHLAETQIVDLLLDSVQTLSHGSGRRLKVVSAMLGFVLGMLVIGIGVWPGICLPATLLVGALFAAVMVRRTALTEKIGRRLDAANELCDRLSAADAAPRRFRLLEVASACDRPMRAAGVQLAETLVRLTPDEIRQLPPETRLALRRAIVDHGWLAHDALRNERPSARIAVAALLCLPYAVASPDDPLLDNVLWDRICVMAAGGDSDPGAAAAGECLRALRQRKPAQLP